MNLVVMRRCLINEMDCHILNLTMFFVALMAVPIILDLWLDSTRLVIGKFIMVVMVKKEIKS